VSVGVFVETGFGYGYLRLWSRIFCLQMSMPSCGICRCAENLCSSGG